MAQRHAPLANAAMEIQLEAALGHLWFEEGISGGSSEEVATALEHVDAAARYARAMLEGGDTPEGVVVPLAESALRLEIGDVLTRIEAFRGIAQRRWAAAAVSGPGSAVDQRFDTLFQELLDQTERVENALQVAIARDLWQFRTVQVVLIALCLGLSALIGVVLRRYERRQALHIWALRRSEQKLSITLDSIGDAVIATDDKGCITRMNPAAEALTGWPDADARGGLLTEVFHIINAKTRETVPSPVTRVLRARAIVGLANHTVLIARDGTERQIADCGAPIWDTDGEISGVVLVFRDVTEAYTADEELRLRERQLSLIYASTADALFYIAVEPGPRYRFLTMNSSGLRATGLTLEQIVGKTIDEVIPEPSLELVRCSYELAIREKRIVQWEETSQYPAGPKTGIVSVAPVFDSEGNCTNLVGSVHDITERRRIQEQYHQAQRVESIGRLAGGIAHDLNNLLLPILAYSQMLLDELESEDPRRQSANEILGAGLRARDLVRQLLAFGRRQTLEYRPTDMNKAVADFENLLRRTLREDIALEFIPSPDIGTVMADIGQIEQVMMNLVVNAQDAMPEGGHLTIKTAPGELDATYAADHQGVQPGMFVVLSISDTGIGMNAATREQAFEQFFSAKGELGSGLGLATVYGIVKQHGGNVWLYSQPGEGTTFKVYLPVSEPPPIEEKLSDKTVTDLTGSETILLVEDDEHVRHLARTLLARQGYTVLSAESGPEALLILASHQGPVQLLLTDVIMPEMNGKELFEKASEAYPDLKVLYMSGYTDDVVAHRGVLKEGIVFIQKPFTALALAAKIRKALEQE